MAWKVEFTARAAKQLRAIPPKVSELLVELAKDLEMTGPVQWTWPNYSRLTNGVHHCHLNYRYVACWAETEKGISLEIYYVGTRENAPY